MNEFDLIKTYFYNAKNNSYLKDKGIVLGNGDDAAVFEIDTDYQLVSSIDTLVENVHFPSNVNPEDIAYKALAVNLSDLAAMGAAPHSFVLSITLPKLDQVWLARFSEGLFAIANYYQVVLLGGDTSQGPLSISIQINGTVKKNEYLKRSAAKTGDVICVTGFLGLGAQGLKNWINNTPELSTVCLNKFLRPEPRLDFSSKLFGLGVRSCIDISDGLLSEINHICAASQLSATLKLSALTIHNDLDNSLQLEQVLTGGDDYELCFSVNPKYLVNVKKLAIEQSLPLNVIGEFVTGLPSKISDFDGNNFDGNNFSSGYKHFTDS